MTFTVKRPAYTISTRLLLGYLAMCLIRQQTQEEVQEREIPAGLERKLVSVSRKLTKYCPNGFLRVEREEEAFGLITAVLTACLVSIDGWYPHPAVIDQTAFLCVGEIKNELAAWFKEQKINLELDEEPIDYGDCSDPEHRQF